MRDLVEEEEFVAVLFDHLGQEEHDDVDDEGSVREKLETIDDELDAMGIRFVSLADEDYALVAHEIDELPALGFYRNGDFLGYSGDLAADDREEILRWFLDESTLLIDGRIEEVNVPLLSYLYETDDDIVVLFYEKSDRDADEIVDGLERIDDKLDEQNITMVKISQKGAERQFGLSEIPALVYIQSGIPTQYEEDEHLFNVSKIKSWIVEEANTTRIHEVSDVVLERLIEKFDYIAAIFYDMEDDPSVENLQRIAGESFEDGIAVVKIKDEEEAKQFGMDEMPGIVFFRKRIASVVTADIDQPDEVLDFLQRHKNALLIEEVSNEILTQMIEQHEYVAVFFRGAECKQDGQDQEQGESSNGQAEEEQGVSCTYAVLTLVNDRDG